jgi:hypothetical protein
MNKFTFKIWHYTLTAYYDDKGYLVDVDAPEDFSDYDFKLCKLTAEIELNRHLNALKELDKKQEAEAKDWENTKWHLNKQFKVF